MPKKPPNDRDMALRAALPARFDVLCLKEYPLSVQNRAGRRLEPSKGMDLPPAASAVDERVAADEIYLLLGGIPTLAV